MPDSRGTYDSELVDFLEFGWPVGYLGSKWAVSALVNHKGATDYPTEIDEYLAKEIKLGAILGLFDENPLCVPLFVSPLHTVPKDKTVHRVISDLSFPKRYSVNSGISKDSYLGTVVNLSYPSVDKFSETVRKKGSGALMYKRDLSQSYRQLPLDPGDIHFMGSAWGGRLFIHRVAMMGMRSGVMMYQRTTVAVVFAMEKEDFDVMNYIDDLIVAEIEDRA